MHYFILIKYSIVNRCYYNIILKNQQSILYFESPRRHIQTDESMVADWGWSCHSPPCLWLPMSQECVNCSSPSSLCLQLHTPSRSAILSCLWALAHADAVLSACPPQLPLILGGQLRQQLPSPWAPPVPWAAPQHSLETDIQRAWPEDPPDTRQH